MEMLSGIVVSGVLFGVGETIKSGLKSCIRKIEGRKDDGYQKRNHIGK